MLHYAFSGDLTDEDINSIYEFMETDGFTNEDGEWIYDNE